MTPAPSAVSATHPDTKSGSAVVTNVVQNWMVVGSTHRLPNVTPAKSPSMNNTRTIPAKPST